MINIDNLHEFNTNFLSLVAKISDSITLKVMHDRVYSISSSNDNTIVVLSTFKQQNDETNVLNIPDINRLARTLNCIPEDTIKLTCNDNNIQYKSNNIRFTYHMLEDGIITIPSISVEKIKQLSFSHKFVVTKQSILSLIKGSSLATDTDKLYLSVENTGVYAELTDKETANVDSYTQLISEDITGGAFDTLAINFEIFRMISSLRFDNLTIKVNTDVNVLMFEVEIANTKHNFICTTYIR